MDLAINGPLGLVVLALDVYAITKIIGSAASTGGKVLWVLLILLLPVIGFIIWLVCGPSEPAVRRA